MAQHFDVQQNQINSKHKKSYLQHLIKVYSANAEDILIRNLSTLLFDFTEFIKLLRDDFDIAFMYYKLMYYKISLGPAKNSASISIY